MPTTSHTDDKKVSKLITKVMKLINKHKLTVPEMVVFSGNLLYHLGASIAGFKGKGPHVEELRQAYYQDPTIDTGLMLQGLLITDWEKDFIKQPKLSTFADKNKE